MIKVLIADDQELIRQSLSIILGLKEEISVEQLLKDYDLNPQKVVVEVNMEILDDEVYSTYLLKNEDTVEVISFVGGG